MRVRVLRPARIELRAAARFYEDRQADLGERFLDAVDRGFIILRLHPEIGVLIENMPPGLDARRWLVPGFPYAIIYEHTRQLIVVHAVAHLSRDPGYWVGR